MNPRLDRATVLAAFATFGVFWGAWGAILPQIERSARVGSATLGIDLLLIGVGALCSMRLAGGGVDRLGPLVVPGSMAAMGVAGILPALARSGVALGAVLFLVGAASGAYDVAINAAAAHSEAGDAKAMMNLAHAGFSLGVVATSLSVGAAVDRGATPLAVLVTCGIVTVALAGGIAVVRPATSWGNPTGPLPATAESSSDGRTDSGRLGRAMRISPSLLILGGICGLAFFVEGAWQSWGSIHIERTFGASPGLGATAPAAFALAAGFGRLMGQGVARRVPARSMLRFGGAMAAGGSALAAVAPSAVVALAGIAIAGLGTSICAPTVFSLTGQVAGPQRRGAAVGTVTTIGYLGFVIGPAMVGVIASPAGLRLALGVVAVASAALSFLGGKAPVPAPV